MHILHDEIGAPQLKIEKESSTAATLMANPLPSGYGVTIGNGLRRVLLSSLPGTAVTAMKIEGIPHEYTTIDGIKETVFDITLNLRALRLKKHTKGVERVEIPFLKKGKVTAKDLKVSSDIEILDPSQEIMTCDGANPKMKMELRIEKGVGYQLVSNLDSAKEEDPNMILVDANFSPVTLVKYEVTPSRVGEQINLDRLTLQVETDGSLDAESAIKLSAGILQNYFELFNKEDAYTDEDFTTSFDLLKKQRESKEKAAEQAQETSFTPIDILGLSQRTLNALVNGGITSVEQLQATPMSQLTQLRGFGQKAKTELDQVLADRGYAIAPEMPKNSNEDEE
ncbi:DNA-directed RNA polymerase subunit alpha [bacterium]|jgi:DNA-directed RNA polymerase subunit alpha|nr:DNA-directed RNA polymerase subunit alpha [bacterium]MBT6831991.1 DNA-directed RNA polymerase subunit alpha [bacterium]MBT6996791.1 DNA-directed RNA polymerase subunit alpha [bacterium]MBT7772084.1 DNA-directed RNA polymerase subunit alpha [bacterium]